MEIRIYQNNNKILVQLTGRVVLDECDRLKGAVVPRIVPGISQVNLDLSKVDFIDSAGLGVLVGMKVSSNKSRANLVLISPSKGVNDILLVSKLDSIFDIITGQESADVVKNLAKPEFLATGEPSGAAPQSASPTFQAPPSGSGGESAADSPKDKIDRLCKDAMEHMRQRDFESAIECYKQVMVVDPNYLPALNNMAVVYEKKPQWQNEAIATWEKVLELSSSRGDQKHVERAKKHLATLQRL